MVHTLTLKTCRRTEVYQDKGRISTTDARHLFRVAAGLESPLLGETAILGQVRRAYDEAKAQGKLSANMNKLFQAAIHVGHRVRTETTISRGAVSYSQVTVDMLSSMMPDLDKRVVSIIGVNDMTESILNFLTARGATNLILANRSFEAAEQLAKKYDAQAVPLSDKRKILQLSDVVISATSAPHSIIRKEDVLPFYRDVLFFDLANPRDIDEEVDRLSGVQVFTLEKIEQSARQNLKARSNAIGDCERIIEEELAELKRWEEYRRAKVRKEATA